MAENKHTIQELWQWQSLPLNVKIAMTKERIREWIKEFGEDGVYVSFSGGKDSTVLLDIVRQDYPNVEGVFIDTGLEYPEIRDFVKTFDNIIWLKPKMNFRQVIEKYGYPFISKEVAECVYGARKYLTKILEEQNLDRQTDRQTDRQLPYAQYYRKVTGQGEYSKFSESPSGYEEIDREALRTLSGGYENKYRKLRGIGLYSKQKTSQQVGRSKSEARNNVGVVHEGQTDKGEYP